MSQLRLDFINTYTGNTKFTSLFNRMTGPHIRRDDRQARSVTTYEASARLEIGPSCNGVVAPSFEVILGCACVPSGDLSNDNPKNGSWSSV